MSSVDRLDAWHKTPSGYLVFGIVELLLFYVFASFAIDSGSWWDYLLAVIFLVGGIKNLVKLVMKLVKHGK